MYKVFILIAVVLTASTVLGQTVNSLKIVVRNHDTKAAIAEAAVTVRSAGISGVTDVNGTVELTNIPDGEQTIEVFSPGYAQAELSLAFPLTGTNERLVVLEIDNEVGEVTVTSTRTGREIENEPTRVEVIDEEEIDEKINMRPGNVSMVLHESTGIQVQQTSATSNTQSVRIQGLDGRYTQILKDGFPTYGGFSGSLSVLEIPPLDLKQVEIIKGPAATLFGGEAIAGVVNFVTKDPGDEPVTTLLFNQTSALGTDFSVFNSQRFDRLGYTLLGSANHQKEYDVDDDDFTELPRIRSYSFTPKLLFYINDKTDLTIANSTSHQNRKGGDIFVIRGNGDDLHQYFEQNRSTRNITTINLTRDTGNGGRLLLKQAIAFFSREITTPGYAFAGRQVNSYTDVSYSPSAGKHALVFGGSALIDRFRETTENSNMLRDESRTTFGAFAQDTVDLNDKLSVVAGLRVDHSKNYGTFALPRISALYKFSERITVRIGFGMGYKTPTMFTEDAEKLLFRNVLPVGSTLKAERSIGGTFDVNYKNTLGKLNYAINQMVFYTQISDPLVLRRGVFINVYRFINANSPVISKGLESNVRLGYGIAKLFIGYTFTDAKAGHLGGDRRLTLLPKHRINSALVFERHESFKAGAEFYFASSQILDDRTSTRSIAEIGLFGEKTFGRYSVFINAENLTDVRQGKYTPVVVPPHQNPSFAELYTHTEGRIFNGGIKIRF